jgi:hypothetical protein
VREENPLVTLSLFPLSLAAAVAGRPAGRRRPSLPCLWRAANQGGRKGPFAQKPLSFFLFLPETPSLFLSLLLSK